MDCVETEADTIEAAIENALKLLGAPRDKITVEVLSQGRKGILGFGSQKAKIRAEIRRPPASPKPAQKPEWQEAESEAGFPEAPVTAAPPEIVEKARKTLEDILSLMAVKATVATNLSGPAGETILEVRADNTGLLIGRKGQTLDALQYLVNRIAVEHPGGDGPHVIVDVENYRERRRRSLEDMALRLGEKAKRQRKTVTVDALSAAERRIIHAVLQDDPWISTKSLGQGAYRRLLIIPEGDRKTRSDAPAQRSAASAPATGNKESRQPDSSPESLDVDDEA